MLTLSRKCDYALIALVHLAKFRGEVASAREIADHYEIPLPLLMNILKLLHREGVVNSVRGARGGYSLAADPEQVSLKDVVFMVEGPVRLVKCADSREDEQRCRRTNLCPVRPSALKLHKKFAEFLDGVSLADIVNGPTPTTVADQSKRGCAHEAGLSG
jgi:Rrf2 family protein